MVLVSIIAVILLILSLFNGFRDGALKQAASLVSLLIAIPLTGLCYQWISCLLSFLPGTNWEHFLGFFITLGIIMVIFYFILLLPRRFFEKTWKEGALFRLVGTGLGFINCGLGMVLFALVINAYPIIDWLESSVTGSGVIQWLASWLGFIQHMLSSVF